MSNQYNKNLHVAIPLTAAGIVLLVLILLFVQVRQNTADVQNAILAMSEQSDSALALRRENQNLRRIANPKLILFIGDAMDDQQITIARNYLVGSGGKLTIDNMPFRGVAQTPAISEQAPDRVVYISDSANTATTIATGVLTSPRRIATTAQTDEDIVTIMEMAVAAGLGTGIARRRSTW
jgi:alkaline phosphatase